MHVGMLSSQSLRIQQSRHAWTMKLDLESGSSVMSISSIGSTSVISALKSVGSATEGFLVGELEERGRLGIWFSGGRNNWCEWVYSQFLLRRGVSLVWINTRATTMLLRSLGRSVVSTPKDGPGWFRFCTVVNYHEDHLPQETTVADCRMSSVIYLN